MIINNRTLRVHYFTLALCLALAWLSLPVCAKKPAQEAALEINTEAELDSASGTLTDKRDGKVYKTVKMPDGNRWMAENLNYQIPDNRYDSSWCYSDSPDSCAKYGRLYDWEAAMSACPAGWHLPTRQEWRGITAGIYNYKGPVDKDSLNKAAPALKTASGWNWNDTWDKSGNGTDDFGFSALPGGERNSVGKFGGIGFICYWWTATEGIGIDGDGVRRDSADIGNGAYRQSISNRYDGVSNAAGYGKRRGSSVRCLQGNDSGGIAAAARREKKKERITAAEKRLKDAEQRIEEQSDYFTDTRDGRKYRAVTIGGKVWMAQNLNYKTGNSWCYENDTSRCGKYGGLYDWNTAKKVCPAGWRLPASREWDSLARAVGGESERLKSGDVWWHGAGKPLKSVSDWDEELGRDGNGSDAYGFSALPGGVRYKNDCFNSVNTTGYWWTATEYYRDAPDVRSLMNLIDIMSTLRQDKDNGYSVRCVKGGK